MKGVFEKIPDSGVWWARYADGTGRIRYEKVGSKTAAERLYHKRKDEIFEGRKLPDNLRSVVRVSELAGAILRDYKNKEQDLKSLESRLRNHILPFFGKMVANDVGTANIDRYVDKRSDAGAENATINRELAALKRMYQLAYDAQPRRIRDVIRYERLKENDPRDGFVENEQYQVLNAGAEELWLKSILATGYTFGFRSSELTKMKVRQVNLNHRTITLAAGTTKNDDARIVVMTTAVHDLISKCLAGKGKDDYVFTRGGEQVKDFRGAWWALCTKADLGKFVKDENEKLKWTGLIFHDLRRSAVRNMIRAGIPEVVAMKISGHKTRSVFDRYNIVSPDDFVKAAAKLEAAAKEPTEPRTEPVKISGARLKFARTA